MGLFLLAQLVYVRWDQGPKIIFTILSPARALEIIVKYWEESDVGTVLDF